MKSNSYRKLYHSELKAFLATPAGSSFLQTISSGLPEFNFQGQAHQHHESAGAVRGYLKALNLIVLLSQPPAQDGEIEATYGVTKKKEEEK